MFWSLSTNPLLQLLRRPEPPRWPWPTPTVIGRWEACPNGWKYSAGAHSLGSITFKGLSSFMTGLDLSGDVRFHRTLEAAADFIEQEAQVDFQGYFKDSGLTVTLKPGPRPSPVD